MWANIITPINIIIACLWFISAVVDYSDFSYLWQLKEYRIDRMRDFFSTRQGKMYWLRYQLIWRSLLALFILFWPINEMLTLKYALVGIFGIDALYTLYRLWKGQFRHPKFTAKAVFILFASLLIEGAIIMGMRDWSTVLSLTIIRLGILSMVVLAMAAPTRLIKYGIIRKATQKMTRFPKLTVIGITGSYGKSSTKEFLTHMLEGRYRVVKTPKNINTEIGVAMFILKTDFKNFDVFVVEMGAYTKGEIKYICDIVHPKIGVLTAINEQHLSLFGTIRDTQQAKYELLRSLPKDGLAVVNNDNRYTREFIHELSATVQTFGYDKENHPSCHILDLKHSKAGMSCDFCFGEGKRLHVDTPLFGDYHAMNLAPCVLIAKHLGMSDEAIQQRAKTLTQTTLTTYQYGNCTILDDSYNANPDGFRSALNMLSTFPSVRRRVVITRGMLELGDKSDELHEKIGEEIAFTANELVLTIRDFEAPLRRGVGSKYRTTIVLKDDPKELLAYVRGIKDTNTVILLVNRIPSIVKDEVTGRS